VRQTIVFVTLLVLLAALGVSLALGASNTRAAARALIEREVAPSPSVSASAAAARSSASAAAPTPSSSAVPEQKPPLDRSLSIIGLSWDLLAPALLAGNGLKSSAPSAFASQDLRVSVTIANTTNDVERALASGGGASGGADLAALPLSDLVVAYERLRALDLRVFLVSGWSRGRDTLTGTSFAKLPAAGSITLDHGGNADALALALLTLDLTGMSLERLKLDDRSPNALLHAKSGGSVEQDASKQEEMVLSTREAARLLPYVLIAPRPLLEERDVVLAAFVQGWLAGTEALLKDRAKAARTLAAFEGAPEALGLLHALGDIEPIRLYENAELLGLSGRGALSIESLVDWQFRARRAARVGRASTPEQSLVDGRVVTRLVRSSPKLLQAPEPMKRSAGSSAAPALLAHAFEKDDEEPIISALGVLADVFPRHDLRLTLPGRAKLQSEWLDRAATRYDLDRARLVAGSPTGKPGRSALVEVLRTP
jgi:hypothetical protein